MKLNFNEVKSVEDQRKFDIHASTIELVPSDDNIKNKPLKVVEVHSLLLLRP